MSKRLGSRALLSSFAAVAVIAGIGGVFDAAHAGSIQVQCASPGIEPGSQDPVNGNAIAVSPINI
ncbi:MAG TPA: hypothetical protein ENO33_02330, partial [Hydrogenobaculum sp.]|nr:hypothetical protein [Hydrogenobaculum sp.]